MRSALLRLDICGAASCYELQQLAHDVRLCWTVQAIGPEQMIAEVPDTLLREGVDDRDRCMRPLRILY